jgi:hypothetical protein
MVDRKELRGFGHLIRMDNNRRRRDLWERIVVVGIRGRGRANVEREEGM